MLKEDEIKIQKASLLFSQSNVEKTTHLKHILKLGFKFLISRKFCQCEQTLEFFKDKLDNEFMIDNLQGISRSLNFKENFNLHDYNAEVIHLFESYSQDLRFKYNLNAFNIPLCFCKELIKAINICFFSYFKLMQMIQNKNISEKQKQNIINVRYILYMVLFNYNINNFFNKKC